VPTVAEYLNAASSVVAAALSVTTAARLSSDLRTDLQRYPVDSTRYQMRGRIVTVAGDSNNPYPQLRVEVRVARRSTLAERAVTEGVLLDAQRSLLDSALWLGAGAYSIEEEPALVDSELVRDGPVIHFTMAVELTIAEGA
jgi:hypothetical protein